MIAHKTASLLFVFIATIAAQSVQAYVAEVAPPQNLGELRLLEKKILQAAAKAVDATVAVRVGPGAGSGIIVSEDGYILTAAHVARQAGEQAEITLADGRTVSAVTLGVYRSADAGMLKISDEGEWPFVELGDRDDIKFGMWCMVLGHPLGKKKGRPPVLRFGRVLEIQKKTLHTDCPMIGGDSGGPLIDLEGKLIGINSRIGADIAVNYHVPIDVFRDNWQRLVDGEVWEDHVPARDEEAIKRAFGEAVAEAAKCVVRVRCDGKDVILGTIVGPDGWILTKASELIYASQRSKLPGRVSPHNDEVADDSPSIGTYAILVKRRIVCRLQDGRDLEARVVGVDPRFDLAMLKIDAVDLPLIHWTAEEQQVGRLVAAVGMDECPLGVGVVSAPRCTIAPPRAAIGVVISQGDEGPRVIAVLPKGPADKAGVKKGDQITHIDGKRVKSRKKLAGLMKQFRPGQKVKLTLQRDATAVELTVKLSRLVTPSIRKQDMLNRTGVGISRRHEDFPIVLQHDTVLRPEDCGGPLVNLDGKAVGVNIARGGRAETYCIPTKALIPLMYSLMSGRARPPSLQQSDSETSADDTSVEDSQQPQADNTEKNVEESVIP